MSLIISMFDADPGWDYLLAISANVLMTKVDLST